MRTYRKIKPGQPGTKELMEIYGSRLVCVRIRYDVEQHKRCKTAEIVIEESDRNPKAEKFEADEIVGVHVDRVELKEIAIQRGVKLAGAAKDSKKRIWEMRYDQAV
ncbi:MAG: hypothetical protein L0226_03395 [Acidobacteria bacterium]|nr:hypothetical protein [Acidobacteriota bacterium]